MTRARIPVSIATWLAALVVGATLVAARASAQSERELDPAEVEEARALFVAGSAAIENGRWADAIQSFERAYAITHAPSALFNVAFSLRALGRHRESRDAFRRLLAEHEIEAAMRRDAEGFLREEEGRVAILELAGLSRDPHAVRLDGRDLPDRGERPLRVETDAGAHTVTAERTGFSPFRWEGTLSDGEHRSLDVVLQPLAVSSASEPIARGDDTAAHVVIVVTIVAALAAGGGVLGWALHEDAQIDPLYPRRVEP